MPNLRGPERLAIHLRHGSIDLIGEDRPDLLFEADPPLVAVEQNGDAVALQARDRSEIRLQVRLPACIGSLEVELDVGRIQMTRVVSAMTVELSRGTFRGEDLSGALDLDGGRGDLVVDGMQGRLHVDGALGSVQILRMQGELSVDAGAGSIQVVDSEVTGELESGTGSIVLIGVSGKLAVESGLGSVDVENPRGLRLDAESAMGPVQVQGGHLAHLKARLGRGDLRIHQSLVDSGDMKIAAGSADLRLDGRQGGRLEALAHHGRVVSTLPRVTLPFSGAPRAGERVVLTFDDGPHMLTVEARRGSITVARGRHDAVDIAGEQAVMRERRLVLEQLRAGTISSEAARRLLHAISRRSP
jgi:hypothetical protein